MLMKLIYLYVFICCFGFPFGLLAMVSGALTINDGDRH